MISDSSFPTFPARGLLKRGAVHELGSAIFLFVRKMQKHKRQIGYVVHVDRSRSSGFWCIVKTADGTPHFALGRNFLDCTTPPKVGRQVSFTLLPKGDGKLYRATELQLLPASTRVPKSEKITVDRLENGRLRICRGRGKNIRALAELSLP